MAKRLTEAHPLTQKLRQVEKLMDSLNMKIEWDGYRLNISDENTTAIYKDIEGGEESMFPCMFESKLVIEE